MQLFGKVMPLPPALAARLAKRGIVGETILKDGVEKRSKLEAEEEIIAENYDSNFKPTSNNTLISSFSQETEEYSALQAEKHFKGHSGCPNKWNVYHECSVFCVRHWGKGKPSPDVKYMRKFKKLIFKYPLPSNWKEVYDPGTGRHYYWEMSSDMVSWLPPGHPRANVTESARTIREEKHLVATDGDGSGHESDSSNEEDEEEVVAKPREKKRQVGEKRQGLSMGRRKAKGNDLDPMDPAAYSGAPRGKWSDGLERGTEAKTGADVTASGPLYQMRPYPSPGAVLRANATKEKP